MRRGTPLTMKMLRRTAILAGGTAAAHTSSALAESATVSHPANHLEVQPQWLWTFDGVRLQRDANTGHSEYFDEATGRLLPNRPHSFPAEAYVNRWRAVQPWELHDEQDAAANVKHQEGLSSRSPAKHLLFIRHAQYLTSARDDAQRTLTSLGQQQCVYLAQRLRALDEASAGNFKALRLETLISSELTRAIQTAEVIAPLLGDPQVSRNRDLNEGRPCLPEPPPSASHAVHYKNAKRDAERIERAYRQLCARPPHSQEGDTCTVVVCHANVIRYLVCRVLQL